MGVITLQVARCTSGVQDRNGMSSSLLVIAVICRQWLQRSLALSMYISAPMNCRPILVEAFDAARQRVHLQQLQDSQRCSRASFALVFGFPPRQRHVEGSSMSFFFVK